MPGSKEQGGDFDWNREDRIHDPFDPKHTWRHFRTLRDSEADLVKAVCKCDKGAFEIHGHQMQDWFSHRGHGYTTWNWGTGIIGGIIGGPLGCAVGGWGHGRGNVKSWFGGLRPDNADDYKDAYDEAEERTQYWVNRWNKCCRKYESQVETPFGNMKWTDWTKRCLRAYEHEECCASVDYKDYDWMDEAPPGKRVYPPQPKPKMPEPHGLGPF